MKAIEIRKHGGIEVLQLGEVADAVADDVRRVVVQLAWSGVNYVDLYQREGRYPNVRLPWRLGLEGAGVVVAADATSGFVPGDRVGMVAPVQGTYAEAIAVAPDQLVRVPDAIPLDVAAAVLEQGLTAQMLVETVARVRAGQRVLIHAAAGGVGALACQWALAQGAEVWGTCSSAEKVELLRAMGVRPLLYGEAAAQPWTDALMDDTHGEGVDIVLDGVAADTFESGLRVLRPTGHMVLFGAASGPVPSVSIPALMSKSLTLTRPVLPHFLAGKGGLQAKAAGLFAKVTGGQLAIRIHERLALADAARAHALLASRATSGKLLLRVSGEV